MTDILDLPGWRVISSAQDQDTYTIEADNQHLVHSFLTL